MTDDAAAFHRNRGQAAEASAAGHPGRPPGVFVLHPQLQADTLLVGRLGLSRLLLMNDITYPWLILVPERAGISEIADLDAADRVVLIEEIALVSGALTAMLQPDKLNVAAIGNVVAQLHVHLVARFRSDPVWPAPIWGRTPPHPYNSAAAAELLARLRRTLQPALRDD
ncbi:MAG: HIT family protein [Rhodospirillales bacterium]